MNGDFKTDITRDSFRRHKNFSRVLMQQGRVQLDADWNEQNDILLHYMRALAHDIIGPHAGPPDDVGFAIEALPASATSTSGSAQQRTSKRGEASGKSSKKAGAQSDNVYKVLIKRGRYYVDGILCEADKDIVYTLEDEQQEKGTFLFYLDVWEREVTHLEDDSIREVALNGADTATRAQVVCEIRTQNVAGLVAGEFHPPSVDTIKDAKKLGQFVTTLTDLLREVAPDFFPMNTNVTPPIPSVSRPLLIVRTLEIEEDAPTDPCIIPPTSQYRGPENQLYRLEVHTSGYGILPASSKPKATTQRMQQGEGTSRRGGAADTTQTPQATFKWSRENGSVTFPIVGQIPPGSTGDITITLISLGRDDSRFTLNVDDWVEIVDYEDTLELEAGQLMRVKSVDYTNLQVTLTPATYQTPAAFDTDSNLNKPQLLRRWDYTEMDPQEKGATTLASDGALEIIENHWLTLEDGIQVLFHHDIDQQSDKDADDQLPYYHTGDYWLIPARAATGDIEWPHHERKPEVLPPHGVVHHYAPLAYVTFDEQGRADDFIDLRRQINQIWAQVSTGSVQINSGGPAVAPFAADTDFTGGTTATSTNTIDTSKVTNLAPPEVYQSYRYGNSFSYAVPGLTAGKTYTVRLHFAETNWKEAGKRIFNVSINGQQVLTSFDIIATVGTDNKATVQQFTATADNTDKITIQFTTVQDNAQVNGIEII